VLNNTTEYLNSFKTAARQITGYISYRDDDEIFYIDPDANLTSIKIERVTPNGKFFGFAVSQKMTVEAIGIVPRIKKGAHIWPTIGIKGSNDNVYLPSFYVDTVEFNKVTNTTTITGYDVIGRENNKLISEINIEYPAKLSDYAKEVVKALGGAIASMEGTDMILNSAPNFDGSETLQTALSAIAEATGTICYVTYGSNIKFRALKYDILDTLTPADYYNFSSGESVRLTEVALATELGDNYNYGVEGFTQVIRENPFMAVGVDVNPSISLEVIGYNVLNLESTAYHIDWRGCPAYEIGDHIKIVEKDGTSHNVYYMNETLTFNGGLRASASWGTVASERVDGTPTTLSKIVGKTYAKVDKINREITLMVEETENLQTEISTLKVEAEGILAEVGTVSEKASNALALADNNMEILSKKVQTAVTSENVSIVVQKEMANGVSSVTTKTGFTFDEDGLTIDKSGSEMTTQITEDGMKVFRDNTQVLVADNKGVEAINLHATTYLIINNLSRFENYTNEYDTKRTGCFWLD
jgi:hypothetical protein